MTAAGIEQMVAQGHFDLQLALVRQHWATVRHLWLDDPDVLAARKLRADLPEGFWIGAGMPGLATIRPIRDGRFEFAEDGRRALVIPCYHVIPGTLDANPAAHVEHLVDLVAVDVDRPERYWRRVGEALVLGNAFLEIAGHEGLPVPVFKTPLSWLRSGGAGIVVLDWVYVRELLLDHELIAEDLGLGAQLEAALRPAVWVREAAA